MGNICSSLPNASDAEPCRPFGLVGNIRLAPPTTRATPPSPTGPAASSDDKLDTLYGHRGGFPLRDAIPTFLLALLETPVP